ncbi:MAG: hypothetical protein AB1345_15085 [Chloroflexota bacterium]
MERGKTLRRQVVVATAIVVGVFIIVGFIKRVTEWQHFSALEAQVAATATQLKQTEISLQTQIAYATSEKAVEEWAIGEGKLVRPGEVLVVPKPDSESTPVPAITPTPTPTPIPNWQVWYVLFFGDVP